MIEKLEGVINHCRAHKDGITSFVLDGSEYNLAFFTKANNVPLYNGLYAIITPKDKIKSLSDPVKIGSMDIFEREGGKHLTTYDGNQTYSQYLKIPEKSLKEIMNSAKNDGVPLTIVNP